MWGDMAKNEGEILEDIANNKPIIAISNVNLTPY